MKNKINENINNSIKWSKNDKGEIVGLNIFDKSQIVGRKSGKSWSDTKKIFRPTGYCGSIEITSIGNHLQIWTNGKYQFIKKEIAIKLIEALKRFYSEVKK